MKGWKVILSVVVIVLGTIWFGASRGTVSDIERETISLEKRIANAKREAKGKPADGSNGAGASRPAKEESIDLRQLLSRIVDLRHSRELSGELLRLEKRLNDMSATELLAGLDEIAGMDLQEKSRESLELAMLPALAAKAPQEALERFVGKQKSLSDASALLESMRHALSQWMEKDLAGACSWMDRKIADGAFETSSLDGVSNVRVVFESTLLDTLFSKDPGTAKLRVLAMSEDEALRVMHTLLSSEAATGDPLAYASLVRETLPEPARIEVLSARAMLPEADYPAVSEYLDKIHSSPAERQACVAAVVESKFSNLGFDRPLTIEEIDAMRAWAASYHSGIDQLTGKALGNAIADHGMNFDQAAALALHYHEATGRDDVLLGFLTSNAHFESAKTRMLAEKLRNPENRVAFLTEAR